MTDEQAQDQTNESPEVVEGPDGNSYTPVAQHLYVPNFDAMQTTEDVVGFLKDLNMKLNLFGDQTLEDVGRDPKWWVHDSTQEVYTPVE